MTDRPPVPPWFPPLLAMVVVWLLIAATWAVAGWAWWWPLCIALCCFVAIVVIGAWQGRGRRPR